MALIWKKWVEKSLQIAVWKIEETVADLEKWMNWTLEESNKYASFTHERRKKEWLSVRILLKNLLGSNAKIEYNSFGKPFLKEGHISITHTNNYVAIAFSPTQSVGIDIEKYSDQVLKLKDRFLNPKELLELKKANFTYPELFAWCAKETLFKIYGKGQVEFKTDLALVWDENRLMGFIHKQNPPLKVALYADYQPDFLLVYGILENGKKAKNPPRQPVCLTDQ